MMRVGGSADWREGPLIATAAAGAAATAVTVLAVSSSPLPAQPENSAAYRGLFVAAYVAAGLVIWRGHRASRIGPMVAGVGLLYAAISLDASRTPIVFVTGRIALAAFVVYAAYVFLCFPHDSLPTVVARRAILALGITVTAGWLLALALTRSLPAGGAFTDCTGACPQNPFHIGGASESVEDVVQFLVTATTAVALLAVIVVLVGNARSPIRLRRRLLEPLALVVIGLALSYVGFTLCEETGIGGPSHLRDTTALFGVAIPVAMVAGDVRGRMLTTSSIADLVSLLELGDVSPGRLESVIRQALGDPSLRLGLWDSQAGRYLRPDGSPLEVEHPPPQRAVTFVPLAGERRAALEHDVVLAGAAQVARAVTRTALVLQENDRLVDSVRASRRRISAAAHSERRQLERDLHDGAQQRLINLQIKIAALRDTAGRVDDLAPLVDELLEDSTAAVEELRVIAHGLYPATLRERGLAEGLRSAVEGPGVTVATDGVERYSPSVEAAVYFTAVEAVQNAVKHGGRRNVRLSLRRAGDSLELAVTDDGPGFDPVAARNGGGLSNMRDRFEAAGGELEIVSAPGSGTTVSGRIPVGTRGSSAHEAAGGGRAD